jgi:hypothetical protein
MRRLPHRGRRRRTNRQETKARYAFVHGDFRHLHRSGLIACAYRAAELARGADRPTRHSATSDLYAKLSDGGRDLMPLGVYPFSARFGWLENRFGPWQLDVADGGHVE